MSKLEKEYFIDISNVIDECKLFEEDIDDSEYAKDISTKISCLLKANSEFQSAITMLFNKLTELDLFHSKEDSEIWIELLKNVGACFGLIDKHISTLTREPSSYNAMKTEEAIKTSYKCLILNPLLNAKKTYEEEIRKNMDISDKIKAGKFEIHSLISNAFFVLYSPSRIIASGGVGSSVPSTNKISDGFQGLYIKSLKGQLKTAMAEKKLSFVDELRKLMEKYNLTDEGLSDELDDKEKNATDEIKKSLKNNKANENKKSISEDSEDEEENEEDEEDNWGE